jgi:hypothetical protein
MLGTPQKFVRKPFVVEGSRSLPRTSRRSPRGVAVRSYSEGRQGGRPAAVHQGGGQEPAERPADPCVSGDWVLSAGTGFKVYTQKAFSGSFEEQTDRMFEVVERMDERGQQEETLFDEGLTEPEAGDPQPAVPGLRGLSTAPYLRGKRANAQQY